MKRRVLISAHIALASAVLMAACGGSEPQPPASAAATPAASVPAPPKMPDVGIYVTNETSGDLTVIDGVTLTPVTTIALGKRPRGDRRQPGRFSVVRRAQRLAERRPWRGREDVAASRSNG